MTNTNIEQMVGALSQIPLWAVVPFVVIFAIFLFILLRIKHRSNCPI